MAHVIDTSTFEIEMNIRRISYKDQDAQTAMLCRLVLRCLKSTTLGCLLIVRDITIGSALLVLLRQDQSQDVMLRKLSMAAISCKPMAKDYRQSDMCFSQCFPSEDCFMYGVELSKTLFT